MTVSSRVGSIPVDLQNQIADALSSHETYCSIANRLNVSRSAIERVLKKRREVITAARKLVSKPLQPSTAVKRDFTIPRWVPHDLRPDFRDNAVLYGEQRAARIVSLMKAEAARPEV